MALRVKIPHEARTAAGRAIPGARLTIEKFGGGAVNVYTQHDPAASGQTIPQPLYADQNGGFGGYVDPGRYTVTISYGGESEVHAWPALNPNQAPFVTVTGYTNSWAAFSGRTPRYRKTSEGFVILQGAMASGTVGSAAFTLPAGYRPSETLVFPCATFGGIGRLDVSSAGVVTPVTPSNNILAGLDIMFYAGF